MYLARTRTQASLTRDKIGLIGRQGVLTQKAQLAQCTYTAIIIPVMNKTAVKTWKVEYRQYDTIFDKKPPPFDKVVHCFSAFQHRYLFALFLILFKFYKLHRNHRAGL